MGRLMFEVNVLFCWLCVAKLIWIKEGRIDFYAIFEQLVQNIIDEGGLEVTLLMYKVFIRNLV